MKSLDFLIPAKSPAFSAGNETAEFLPSAAKSSEPFDALMNRALTQPAQEYGKSFYTAKKSPGASRSVRVAKNDASASRKPKLADHATSSAPDASSSPATHDLSVRGAAKEKHGGDSSDEDSDSINAEANDPSISAGADSASGAVAAALQTLASSEAVQIALPASAAVAVSKNVSSGAKDNPGATGGITQDATLKATDEPGDAKDVSAKISKPGTNEPAGEGKEISASSGESAKNSSSAGGGVPIQALLDKAEISKEPPLIAANSRSGTLQSPTSEAAGISSAQQVATMKNTDNAPQIAGQTEQNLPGVTVVAAGQSPARGKPAAKGDSRIESLETTATANSSAVDRAPAPSETSSSNSISASSQHDLRVRTLDRTHDIMALHGMRLKESSTDSLHVVIKPGAGLQLSLQLKQNGDGIEAHAVLQRGDFNQLNQHWTELQQRLEQRGIRLAPLGNENSAASNSNENFQRQPHQPAEKDSMSVGAFVEFAPASPAARSTASRATTPRSWESWA